MKIIALVLVLATITIEARQHCPESNPYAYDNGHHCCKYPHEKVNWFQGGACNGGEISITSKCCKDDAYTVCPNGICDNYPSQECPVSYPYAYYDGRYCCKYSRENVYHPHGTKCDGGKISLSSTCCEEDASTACPHGGKCQDNTTPQCPASYPNAYYNGYHCCKYSREKFDGHSKCDGGKISLTSECCKDNAEIKCPDGKCIDNASPQCPASYPYAYYRGEYCCKNPRERYYSPFGDKCDGGPISNISMCCENNENIKCPRGQCGNYAPQQCPVSHPYAYHSGEYCCKNSKEGHNWFKGSSCDGGKISIISSCCEGDVKVKCPHGKCINSYAAVYDNDEDYSYDDLEWDYINSRL